MSGSPADEAVPDRRLETGFFERLFDSAGLPIFACDLTGRIVACNPLGAKLFSRGDKCPAGHPLAQLLPGEDRRIFEEHLQSCAETRAPLEFRTRLTRPGALATEYAVWFTPFIQSDGALQGVTVWFHDITSRLQLRRGLRKRERLSTLGALAGAVAHHYNNFLCSIATSLEYAMNMNTMAAMRRALRRPSDAIVRATELTRQLLAFAQADHRGQDLSDLTETVLYYFDRNETRLRQHQIHLALSWHEVPTVSVPHDQLMIILNNLVDNAIEAMPNGGTLTVTLGRHQQNGALLSVADSGGGISPQDIEHLFEPFYTSKGDPGSGGFYKLGMGLAVVHGLVAEMRGTISATNVPGGARFDIRLPADTEN